MWLVPLLFTIVSYVNAFLSLHHYTQCLVRPLRVGDVITIKGHVIAGAEQWKCSISLQGMNHVIIHADHRITTGRGNPCTVLNSSFRTEWGEEYVKKDTVPFSGGPFQMTFRILEELLVEVYYKDAAWPGTSYARNETISLTLARQVQCHGDVLDVTFHGDMLRGKVLPVENRADCLNLPKR